MSVSRAISRPAVMSVRCSSTHSENTSSRTMREATYLGTADNGSWALREPRRVGTSKDAIRLWWPLSVEVVRVAQGTARATSQLTRSRLDRAGCGYRRRPSRVQHQPPGQVSPTTSGKKECDPPAEEGEARRRAVQNGSSGAESSSRYLSN